jgi:hypothetical protein
MKPRSLKAETSGSLRERTGPRECLTQRVAQPLLRDWERELRTRDLRAALTIRQRRVRDHLFDGRDACERFLCELAERVRHRTDEAAVEVHGAATHAGDNACVCERSAFEPRKDQVASWSDAVVQDAEDVRLEFLELVTLKHCSTGRHHPWLELADREGLRLSGKPGNQT